LAHGVLSDDAKTVIDHRDAEVITIESANALFEQLDEKLASLRDLDRPHPLSVEAAVATVKRYLADDRHRVRLEDLMAEETEVVFAAAAGERTNQDGETLPVAYARHMQALEVASEKLCRMGIALACQDDGSNAAVLARILNRLLQVPHLTGTALQHLQRYPALLFFYSVGIAALQAERYRALAQLMLHPTVRQRDVHLMRPAIEWLTPADVLEKEWLPAPHRRNYAFGSSYICASISDLLHRTIPDGDTYIRQFDLFDGLVGLVFRDLVGDQSPIGVYVWRWVARRAEHPLQEFVRSGAAEDLVSAGFFRGSRAHLDELMAAQEGRLDEARRAYH